jgi:CBS domain-containing protein
MKTRGGAVDLDGRHRVQSLVARPVVYVHADDSLRTVAQTLTEETIGAALVRGTKGHAIGLVSERDIVRALADGAHPDRAKASDIMAEELVTVAPGDELHDAIHTMLDAEVRHLPVVDADVHYGMVSARDALRALLEEAEGAE